MTLQDDLVSLAMQHGYSYEAARNWSKIAAPALKYGDPQREGVWSAVELADLKALAQQKPFVQCDRIAAVLGRSSDATKSQIKLHHYRTRADRGWPYDHAEIKRLYGEGVLKKEIQRLTGASISYIGEVIREADLPRRRPRKSPPQHDNAIASSVFPADST